MQYVDELQDATHQHLRFWAAQAEREAINWMVLSLDAPDFCALGAEGAVDFSDMLSGNARALNAAFEFYMSRAAQSSANERRILMALRMQAQLTRTIDTWRRLENSQNSQNAQSARKPENSENGQTN